MPTWSRLLPLLVREEWRDLPSPTQALHSGVDGALAAAAAALNAGEPKRARRILDGLPPAPGDHTAVAGALRVLSRTLDLNWYPGGGAAVLDEADAEALYGRRPKRPVDAKAALVAAVADFLAALPLWRQMAAAGPVPSHLALGEVGVELDGIHRAEEPAALAPVALAGADLFARAGDGAAAYRAFQLAVEVYRAAHDAAGVAACELVRGDWCAWPGSSPELLGEPLEGLAAEPARAGRPDPLQAESHWSAAEAAFRAMGARRGLAAVALRRAAQAVAAGGPADALGILAPAHELAQAAGDGALVQLISVHRALAAIQAGDPADPAAVGGAVGAWARGDGSTTFARGLSRLCLARSRRWRERDAAAGRQAHLLAEAIAGPVGAPAEAAMLDAAQAARYGSLNYRRAAMVLTVARLETARGRTGAPRGPLAWVRLVDQVAAGARDALAQRDATALAEIERHAVWLRGCAPSDPPVVAAVVAVLDGMLAEMRVFLPLYRSEAALSAGDLDTRAAELAAALTAARTGPPLGQVAVLAARREFAEAHRVVDGLLAAGLRPDLSATLLVRVRRYDDAINLLDHLDRHGGQHLFEQPWAWPALWAEALVGAGRAGEARSWAQIAVDAIERHLAGLPLDVFRTMAADDPVIAGVYTTSASAYAALSTTDSAYLARGFELSDRSRGGSLRQLVELGGSVPDQGAAGAVREWQRAGAALARVIEEIAGRSARPAPDAVQETVRAAERDLDEAEARLAASPGGLLPRRRLPVTPTLAEIQERLPADTLLLQYHAYNDELIGWAVTRQGADVVRQRLDTPALTGHVMAFHRAASSPARGDLAPSADPLAPLLAPFEAHLRSYPRVVVVPAGPLAVLPFHLLPHDGGRLADTHVVSYLPAASAAPQAARGIAPDGGAAVIGDPAYDPGRRLARLPGTGLEAAEVARLYGTTALTGGAARRDGVLRRLRDAGVIHLATHGSFRGGAPYSTELALAGAGSLTIPDLVGLGLRADLAVLSACDSGRGYPTAAGDLVGLTRTLLAAGAAELVVALWPVDDMVGCLTMVAFHRALRAAPGSVGGALAAAQRKIRALSRAEAEEWYRELGGDPGPTTSDRVRTSRDFQPRPGPRSGPAHPFYWAPFIHVGTS